MTAKTKKISVSFSSKSEAKIRGIRGKILRCYHHGTRILLRSRVRCALGDRRARRLPGSSRRGLSIRSCGWYMSRIITGRSNFGDFDDYFFVCTFWDQNFKNITDSIILVVSLHHKRDPEIGTRLNCLFGFKKSVWINQICRRIGRRSSRKTEKHTKMYSLSVSLASPISELTQMAATMECLMSIFVNFWPFRYNLCRQLYVTKE